MAHAYRESFGTISFTSADERSIYQKLAFTKVYFERITKYIFVLRALEANIFLQIVEALYSMRMSHFS